MREHAVIEKFSSAILIAAVLALPVRVVHADEAAALSELRARTAVKQTFPDAPVPSVKNPRAAGRNVTAEYYSVSSAVAVEGAELGGFDRERFLGYRILVVPGFMTDTVVDPGLRYMNGRISAPGASLRARSVKSRVAADKLVKSVMAFAYFEEQVNWLRANGLDAGIAHIESESGIARNAALIAVEIERSPKPVIILGHSKGGLDSLEALIGRPDLRGKVRGFISIQSPYYGTPIADYVLLGRHSLAPVSAAILTLMGGSLRSVQDMSVRHRRDYQYKNAAEIARITSAIPTISFGAWKDEEKGVRDTWLKPTRDIMLKWNGGRGIKNDGLVPVDSEMLPGADQIEVEGLDHLAPVINVGRPEMNRVNFIKTLLTMLAARGV
ncbi:MAG: hypothetical protein WCW52_10945 [Elusimicrobiales bacterium]